MTMSGLSKLKSPIRIPIIDMSCLKKKRVNCSSTNLKKRQLAVEIYEACRNFGCFHVVGHGIDEACSNAMMTASKNFFALPSCVKESIPLNQKGFNRGYIQLGGESGSDMFEVKEGFSYGYNWDSSLISPKNPLQGPNIWPDHSKWDRRDQDAMTTYFHKLVEVSEDLVGGISLSLDKPESLLKEYCTEGNTISLIRLMHYFPYDKVKLPIPEKDRIGSSPHTDWGFLTLIASDDIGGLEIYHNKEWFRIPHVKDSLFVNCGDYLSSLTNSEFVSPLHRVQIEEQERYSTVFFYYPSFDATIDLNCMKTQHLYNSHITTTKPSPGNKNLSFGEWILKKWDSVLR